MENEPESASGLAWRLTIEALASFNQVKPSLLHDVIEKASELSDDARKNAGEMVALRCLEGLFGSLNDVREDSPPAHQSKVTFDSSESCEYVVKRIYKETPKSALRVAGPEMLKWDVSPFIAQKRASMRSTLHQLKDTILDGTHPYVDFLKPKSGLVPVNKRDGIALNNDDRTELSRRLDSSSPDSQGQKEKGKGSPLLLEDERRPPVADPSSSSLLTSERSRADHASEDEASQLPGCDDGFVNVKKPQESGLASENNENSGDNTSWNSDDHIELNRRLDSSSSDPQGRKEKISKSLPFLEDERRPSVAEPSSSSLLPSKRSRVDHASEDEASQFPGCDDGFMNVKKLQKSGLASENNENNGDNTSWNSDDHIELNRRLDSSSSDPQGRKEKISKSPLLLEDERRPSVADPSSSSLLPSKRSRVYHASEDEASQLPGCDDDFMNVKKLQKSGLAFETSENNRDRISLNNDDHIEVSRRLDSSSSNPQGRKEKINGSPLLLEDKRRPSGADPSSSSLLRSQKSRVDHASEDEASQLPGCDDGYLNLNKLNQHSARTLYSGQEVASSHGTELLEDSTERVVPQNEGDDNPLDECTMTLVVEDKLADEEHFGPKRSEPCTATDELHQAESGIPCHTMPARVQDDEMHEIISVEKVNDRSVLPSEPKASNSSCAEGNMHNNRIDDSKCDSGHDNHVNAINTMSHSEFWPETVATDIDVGMNPDEEEKDMLSDSDGHLNDTIDIAMKKNEFFSSQCVVDHDSFPLADRKELTVCVKCNEGGQLLSCNISDCSLVVHDKCLGFSARMNDEGDFCCPFCFYSLAISEYLEAKENAALAKKNVATFIRIGLEHQSIFIKEVLQRKDLGPSRKAGVEDVAKICEDVNLENKDNQVTLDGEHVNEVIDHQSPKGTDIERTAKLSKPLQISNSNHRENEANPLRVAPDVLAGEKDGDELVDQECEGNTVEELVDQEWQGNTVEELVDQEWQGNTVEELVDQECQGNVAELEDGLKATEQYDIYEFIHEDQGPVEAVTKQEGLRYQTDDNDEEPVYAINIEGEKSSDDENDESIISRYSIRFRQEYHRTCPETPQSRRKKLPWTAEEEETLREGVRKFSSSVDRSPTIPWKKILEFGSTVFLKGRTSIDLKDKWRNLCRSPKFK
ncbi:uncharacterized protein LOC111021537 isoform X3 [Momordica charantia]|uniref:Uncharacterized protein LOC111021537 isoform X3 n=1 Tax=Momordica charantia TaxID=3673 RepID=A0A6J1DN48_MOMCH|nr:uncharacterized protein LOC111021537 isoform X3 [Momordica charantia]